MTERSEIKVILMKLGFTSYQASVLESLLIKHSLSADEIASISGVPLPKVYQVVNELMSMGLVEKEEPIRGRKARYRVHSLDRVLAYPLEVKKRELKALEELVANAERSLKELLSSAGARPEALFDRMYRAGTDAERHLCELYASAKREIDIMSTVMRFMPNVMEGLKAASDRGVRIRVILHSPSLVTDETAKRFLDFTISVLRSLRGAEVRFRRTPTPILMSICDPGEESGVAVFTCRAEVPKVLRTVVETKHPRFIKFLKEYFDLIWEHEATPHEHE